MISTATAVALFHDRVQPIDAGTGIVATRGLWTDVFLHRLSTLLDQSILWIAAHHETGAKQLSIYRLGWFFPITLTSWSIQAAARILTTLLGLIKTSSR